jgi:hypothetical protein
MAMQDEGNGMQSRDERCRRHQPGSVDIEQIGTICQNNAADSASPTLQIERIFCQFR